MSVERVPSPQNGGGMDVDRLELDRDRVEDERYLRMNGYSDTDAKRIAEQVAKYRGQREDR